MPVWNTPSSSSYSFDRIAPATLRPKKKKDEWWDLPGEIVGNFASDIKDSAVGIALGVPRAAGHILSDAADIVTFSDRDNDGFRTDDAVAGMALALKEDYKYTYGPLVGWGGDFDPVESMKRIKEHPLGPVLDVLALFSGGAALAGKAGKVAAASGSARGAKVAGLESAGKLFNESGGLNADAVRMIAPKRADERGRLAIDERLFSNGKLSPSAYSEIVLGKKIEPSEKNIHAVKVDLEAIARDLQDRVKSRGGVIDNDGNVLLPRTKQVRPKGSDANAGYERVASSSYYTRWRQDAVDKFAAKYHNAPAIGASRRGARESARRLDDQSMIKMQVLASRLKRDQEMFRDKAPSLYRAFPFMMPTSLIESRTKARNSQLEQLGQNTNLRIRPEDLDLSDNPEWVDTPDAPSEEYFNNLGLLDDYKTHEEMFGETHRYWDDRSGYSETTNEKWDGELAGDLGWDENNPAVAEMFDRREWEDDGYVYRGMTAEELADILRKKDLDHKGELRYDPDQQGVSFSKNPGESADWVNRFAMNYDEKYRKDRFTTKKYIIKMKDNGKHPVGKIRSEREVHPAYIRPDDIEDIIEVQPFTMGERGETVSLYKSLGPATKEADALAPSSLHGDLPDRIEAIRSEITAREIALASTPSTDRSARGIDQRINKKPGGANDNREVRLQVELDAMKRELEFLERSEAVGEKPIAALMNESEYLDSDEFKAVRAALTKDQKTLDIVLERITSADPERGADLARQLSDPKMIEGFKGFLRDSIRAYYTDIAPNMVFSRQTGKAVEGEDVNAPIKGQGGGRSTEIDEQVQRGYGEERQFRELAGNPMVDPDAPHLTAEAREAAKKETSDMEAKVFSEIREIVGDEIFDELDQLRHESQFGLPVLSHAIVREGIEVDGGPKGKIGDRPGSNSPIFKKTDYISNEFALSQMNGMAGITRALEHAAMARSSTARFRGLMSQMYKGAKPPAKRGWVALDDVKTEQLRNGVNDIVSFLEDDFQILSGGNRIDMVDSLSDTMRKFADDLQKDAEGQIWVPAGSMKALFTTLKREEHMAAAAWTNATRFWRNMTLGIKPSWMVNNMIGNLTLLALEHGLWTTIRSLHTAYFDSKAKGYVDEMAPAVSETGLYADAQATANYTSRKKLNRANEIEENDELIDWLAEQDPDASVGDTIAKMSLIDKARAKMNHPVANHAWETGSGIKGLRLNSKFIDDPARRAALIANLDPHVKRVMKSAKISKAEAIARVLADDEIKDWAISKTMKDMIDYRNMSPFERKWIRGAFPFYAWMRGMSKRYGELLIEKPMLMAAIQQVSEVNAANPDFDERFPDWMQRLARIDNETLAGWIGRGQDGTAVVDFGPANIFQTPADIAHLIDTMMYGGDEDLKAAGSVANYSNPFLKAVAEVITGTNLYTGNQLDRNITNPEWGRGRLLGERIAEGFPVARDIINNQLKTEDPAYISMTQPGELLAAGQFFDPISNRLINEEQAMAAKQREIERYNQLIERAEEIRKRKAEAGG